MHWLDPILVATWQKIFVRWPDGSIQPVADKGGPFYGVTYGPEYVYAADRAWGKGEHDNLRIYDRSFKLLEIYELPTSGATHQIYWHMDGWVYITDTGRDRVIRWKPDEWEVVFDLGTGEDIHHINSIWHDGYHWNAAGLHGHIWRNWRPWSRFDFQVHNIYSEDGAFIVGASDRQAVWTRGKFIDIQGPVGILHDKDDLWQAYTRGLARSKHYFYVGAAAVQDERNERWQGNSAIVVFKPDWEVVEVLRFKNTGGMHDIRVIDPGRTDWAHNSIQW